MHYSGTSLNCLALNSLWYLSTFASLLPLWHSFFPSRLHSSPYSFLQCESSVWGPNELPDCFHQQNSPLDTKTQLRSNKHPYLSDVSLSLLLSRWNCSVRDFTFKTPSSLCVIPPLVFQLKVIQPRPCVQMPLVPLPVFDCPRISGHSREQHEIISRNKAQCDTVYWHHCQGLKPRRCRHVHPPYPQLWPDATNLITRCRQIPTTASRACSFVSQTVSQTMPRLQSRLCS